MSNKTDQPTSEERGRALEWFERFLTAWSMQDDYRTKPHAETIRAALSQPEPVSVESLLSEASEAEQALQDIATLKQDYVWIKIEDVPDPKNKTIRELADILNATIYKLEGVSTVSSLKVAAAAQNILTTHAIQIEEAKV